MRCFYLFVLYFSILNVYGQQLNFKALTDSAKHYLNIDSEQALRFAFNANNLANEMKNNEMDAESKRLIGLAYYNHGYVEEALGFMSEALEMFYILEDSIKISSCYNALGFINKDLNNFDRAAKYFKKALEIDVFLNDVYGQAVILNNLGELYHLQSYFHVALFYYHSSLNKEIEINNKRGIADSYLNLGVLMKDNGLFEAALIYYNKALQIYEQTDNEYRLGQIYNNIGMVLFMQGFYIKSLEAFEKSIFYKEKVKDIQGKITTLLNVGHIYVLKRDTIIAKKFFARAVLLDNKFFGDKDMSDIEANMQKITTYDDYLFHIISSDLASGNYYELPERLYNRARISMLLGDYHEAIPYLLNSLEIADFFDLKTLILSNCKALFESYFNMGDYKNASIYAKKYMEHAEAHGTLSFSNFHDLFSSDFMVQDLLNQSIEEVKAKEAKVLFYRSFWFYSTIALLLLSSILVGRRFIEKLQVNNTCQPYKEK